MRFQILIFTLILVCISVISGKEKITGFVKDNQGNPIQGANIFLEKEAVGSSSDQTGYFEINNLNKGSYKIRITCIGFKTLEEIIELGSKKIERLFVMTESAINMNEIVITATRTEKTLKNVPVLTKVINNKDIENMGVPDIVSLLENQPSINFSQDNHGENINMNGLGNKYVLFLIDGEKMSGEVKGNIDFNRINTSNIKKIEIVKGASSSLYGSNAIGGVINIISKDSNKPIDISVNSKISKFNSVLMDGSAGIKLGNLKLLTSLQYNKTEGYDLTSETIAKTVDEFNSFSGKYNVAYKFAPSFLLSAGIEHYRMEKFESVRVIKNKHPLYNDFIWRLGMNFALNEKINISIKWNSDNYSISDVMEKQNNNELKNYENLNNSLKLVSVTNIENHTLNFGIEKNYEKVFSDRITGKEHNADSYSIFVQDEFIFSERISVTAGFRIEHHSEYKTNFSPKLSFMYNLLPFLFRANVGTGYRAPLLKELYMNWDHGGGGPYVFGNKDIKPEKSFHYSVSAEYLDEKFNSSFSFFQTNLNDMIATYQKNNEPNISYYSNIERAATYGFEIISTVDVGYGFDISCGYTYTKTENKNTGTELFNIPAHQGSFKLNYNLALTGANLTLGAKFTGRKLIDITEVNEKKIYHYQPAYAYWNINILQPLGVYLKLYAGVQNLFNYTDKNYLVNPGRVAYAGIKFNY